MLNFLKCRLYHNWGQWKDEDFFELLRDKIVVGYRLIQVRSCKDCGKKQYITVEHFINKD